MTIGIDASRANTTHRTGTEWYSFFVIQELKKIIPPEHTVVLYTREPLCTDLADLPTHWKSKVLHWPIGHFWTHLRLSWEQFIHAPDVLYVPAHTIPLIHPKKVVTVLHDIGFEKRPELYNQEGVERSGFFERIANVFIRLSTGGRYDASERSYHRFSAHSAVRNASMLITVSDFSKKEIMETYNIPSEHIVVAHNGIDDSILEQIPQPQAGLQLPQWYILALGRIEKKKNSAFLIDVFVQLHAQDPTLTLVLAGSEGFGAEEVHAKIKQHGLEKDVLLLGWVNEEVKMQLLRNALAMIHLAQYEGFGIPILEAMAVGTPVVCSNIPPLMEVGGETVWVVDPQDVEQCAETVLHVTRQTPDVKEKARLAVIRSGDFRWEHTAKTTWGVIQDVLQQ